MSYSLSQMNMLCACVQIGTVKALPLPMACTLTQFELGNIYHFAVRAVDIHGRCSAFSEPGSIYLDP